MRNVVSVVLYTFGVFLLLVLICSPRIALAQSKKADSLIALLPTLQGAARVDAITHICDEAYAIGDASMEQLWLEELMLEAEKNEQFRVSGYAAISLLISYYNYELFDKLDARFDEIEAFQLKYDNINYYYSGWNVKVESLMSRGEYYQALSELNRMQTDAHTRQSSYGEGIALCSLGQLYYEGWKDKAKAFDSYVNGLALLRQQDYISGTELIASYDYCSLLLYEKEYTKARQEAELWADRLSKTFHKREESKTFNTTNEYFAYYYAFMTLLEVKCDNRDKAQEYFSLLEKFQTMSVNIIDRVFYEAYEDYYCYTGLWDSALVYNNRRLTHAREENHTQDLLPALRSHARILYNRGEYFTAAHNLREYIQLRDSIDVEQNKRLLEEFSAAHKLKKQEASEIKLRSYVSISLIVLTVLLGLGLQFFWYVRTTRRKNKILYSAIRQSLLRHTLLTLPAYSPSAADVTPNPITQTLYTSLEILMREKQLFRISNLSRRDLVRILETTPSYLQETLKVFADGKTLKEYFNQYRLDYAVTLLAKEPKLPPTEVARRAGFRSQKEFTHLFQARFNTPSSE